MSAGLFDDLVKGRDDRLSGESGFIDSYLNNRFRIENDERVVRLDADRAEAEKDKGLSEMVGESFPGIQGAINTGKNVYNVFQKGKQLKNLAQEGIESAKNALKEKTNSFNGGEEEDLPQEGESIPMETFKKTSVDDDEQGKMAETTFSDNVDEDESNVDGEVSKLTEGSGEADIGATAGEEGAEAGADIGESIGFLDPALLGLDIAGLGVATYFGIKAEDKEDDEISEARSNIAQLNLEKNALSSFSSRPTGLDFGNVSQSVFDTAHNTGGLSNF